MKIKTSELIGPALDWAVAKCEEPVGGYKAWVQEDLDKGILHGCRYSTDWEWSGPIIERERISVIDVDGYDFWKADKLNKEAIPVINYGPTPLIAAMRVYVASKLGDEVEVPDDFDIYNDLYKEPK